ncbi:GNAT family N-acetyltransferase [Streptosporangium sp. NPDC051022]|uniref:GNAT family N-acetyltransferase n=1 Tax=Streptosporangium sp. NPDC051022 TaxID=3155752 RepID=UPI0034371B82
MKWTFTSNPEVYAGAAEAWLLRDPVRNTVLITILRAIRGGLWGDDVLMGWAERDGETVASALQTASHPLLLADMPEEAVRELAAVLIEAERKVPAVTGPLVLAETFAAAWWRPGLERRSERLYRLGSLVPPSHLPEGGARTASGEDLELLVEWTTAFQIDAGGHAPPDLTPLIASRIGRHELVLWEVDGRSVACAGASAPIAGMSRVGPVYTPPEERGKGYGTAVTHAVTAKVRSEGATEVLLFTDLSNPTSNAIYQAIGYRPVADYASIVFA